MSGDGRGGGANVGAGGGVGRLRKLRSVVKAGLRSNFGLAILKHRLLVEKKDRWLVPLIGLAALGVVPMFYGIVLLIENVYLVLKPMGQERVLLSFGILAGQILILLFGIYYVIAAFYFSRDLEFLIPLPLRPGEVMASKFAVIVINEYLTVAAIVLPVVITVGVLARAGIGYWVNATLVYLALPIIPLAVVSLAVVTMMRFINISRKKDAFILVGSLVLIGLSFSLQLSLGRSAGTGGPDGERRGPGRVLHVAEQPALQVRGHLPARDLGDEGDRRRVQRGGIGESGASPGGVGRSFRRDDRRGREALLSRPGRARRDDGQEAAADARRDVAARLVRAEGFRGRLRAGVEDHEPDADLPAQRGARQRLRAGHLRPDGDHRSGRRRASGQGGDPMALVRAMMAANPLIVILGSALFMTICGSINGTASSTFSREGAEFWISRVIPVAPREQAAAKFVHSYLVAMLGVVTASIVAAIFFHLKAAHLAPAFVLSMVAGVLLTAVGMMIDLARPLLDWTNPQKAIKQNLNVLLALLADVGILTAVFFGAKALIKAKLGTNVVLGIVFAGLAALAAASYRTLLNFADRRYPQIE